MQFQGSSSILNAAFMLGPAIILALFIAVGGWPGQWARWAMTVYLACILCLLAGGLVQPWMTAGMVTVAFAGLMIGGASGLTVVSAGVSALALVAWVIPVALSAAPNLPVLAALACVAIAASVRGFWIGLG